MKEIIESKEEQEEQEEQYLIINTSVGPFWVQIPLYKDFIIIFEQMNSHVFESKILDTALFQFENRKKKLQYQKVFWGNPQHVLFIQSIPFAALWSALKTYSDFLMIDHTKHIEKNCNLFHAVPLITPKEFLCASCRAPIDIEWTNLNEQKIKALWEEWKTTTESFLYWIPEEVLADIVLLFYSVKKNYER
jgi:hypothetical protein